MMMDRPSMSRSLLLCFGLLLPTRITNAWLSTPILTRAKGLPSLASHIQRHAVAVTSASPSDYTDYKPLKYDGPAISRLAMKQWWRVLGRITDVGGPILAWLALVNSDEMMGRAKDEDRMRIHAANLREMLTKLGPTYIKIGQALANRPDIVGPIYVKELEKLTDTVGPFPDYQAFRIIEQELGRPAKEIYEFIGKGPVASASLGQVYKARIKATGELVAIKVQRPNAFKLAEVDLALLRTGAGWLKKARKLRSDLERIVDEIGMVFWEEMDYIHEAANCKKFKQYYEVLDGISAPGIYDDLTSQRVLTMEWIEGSKLPWGDDFERLIGLGLECSVFQLLSGVLHSDPHAGNLLRRTDNGGLCYLDHGMVTQISEEQRYGLVKAVSYLFNKDFDKLADSFVDLGFVSGGDRSLLDGFGPALQKAFTSASSGDSLVDLNFARLADNMADVAYKFPIRIPPYWSLVIRCLTILEGIALQYNPNFKVVQGVYPFILKFLLQSSSTPALRIALKEILLAPVDEPADVYGDYVRRGRVRYRIRWNRLERMLEAASRPTSEMLNPATTAPSSSSSAAKGEKEEAVLSQKQEALDLIFTYVLSDEGAFLREALLEDILGALDDANLVVLRGLSLISGGLLAPPPNYPNRDRLTVVGSLLQNLSKMSTDRSFSSSLSTVQSTALMDLSRQVLAAYAERQAVRVSRDIFHRIKGILTSRRRPIKRRRTNLPPPSINTIIRGL